jgi:peptidoglycan-associated lipoprotein
MKYSMLAAALSLTLGSGLALAAGPEDPQNDDAPTTSEAAPAESPTSHQGANAPHPGTQAADTQQAQATDKAKDIKPVDVLFDTSSADLSTAAGSELATLARWAKCNAKGAIILEGHADDRGSQAYNMKLSAERAAAVRDKLIAMGVPSDRIVVAVFGKNGPRRSTLAEDRRVTARATTTPVESSDVTAFR